MEVSSYAVLILFTLYSVASACAGVWFVSVGDISRRVVPLSGAILVFVALFWILPELAEELGWPAATALLLSGSVLIFVVDRFVYPICPACSTGHDHAGCTTRLHGFAPPLIAASLLHSTFDGWALMASNAGLAGHAISLGIALHRLPEGFAFGVILRAAVKSRGRAMAYAAIAQGSLLIGGLLEKVTAEYVGGYWISVLLAFGGGTLLFLGFHALHGEWKRRVAAQRGS